jgi:hypothetical protein
MEESVWAVYNDKKKNVPFGSSVFLSTFFVALAKKVVRQRTKPGKPCVAAQLRFL